MTSFLSILANSLSEEIHKIEGQYRQDAKNVKLAELNINIGTAFLNT